MFSEDLLSFSRRGQVKWLYRRSHLCQFVMLCYEFGLALKFFKNWPAVSKVATVTTYLAQTCLLSLGRKNERTINWR